MNRYLAMTRKKAGPFVRYNVDAQTTDASKFQRLLDLEQRIAGGYGWVSLFEGTGACGGGVCAFPYYMLIKKTVGHRGRGRENAL